jgi:hypothetical protein
VLAGHGRPRAGLVAFARDDLPGALRWLDDATRRADSGHDRYAWIHAFTQEAVCQVTVAARLPRAKGDVARLAAPDRPARRSPERGTWPGSGCTRSRERRAVGSWA